MTSTAFRHDKLWPVLTALVALLAGAIAVEAGLKGRQAPPIVTVIDRGVDTTVSSEADGDDAGDDTRGTVDDTARPVDADHERARALAHRGDVAAAVAMFQQVAAAHPDDGHLLAELGYWQLAGGDARAARRTLERARELLPSDPLVALDLGIVADHLDDRATAEAELRRALALRPTFGGAHAALGRLLRKTGRVAEAIAELETAASAGGNEERARALVALGRAYLDAKRDADADDAFGRAIDLAPAATEVRLGVARAYTGADQPDRALTVLAEALRIAPDVAELHAAVGRAREAKKDLGGAEEAYERALRLDPSYQFARRRLLRLALDREDFPRADLHAQYLLRDAGDVPEHHFLAGLVAARQGHADDARRHYRDAIEKANGDYPEAWFNIGLVEKNAGDVEAAIAAYRKALETRPTFLAALNNLGLALEAAGKRDEAEASYRSAIAADQRYAPAWLNLGDLYSAEKRWDDAVGALRAAIAARPGYPRARLNLSMVLRKAGRVPEAVDTAAALVAEQPRYVSGWVAYGAALAQVDRVDEAEGAYRRALELDADSKDARRGLADLLADASRLDEAAEQYGELLDRAPRDRAGRLGLARVHRAQGDLAGCRRDAELVLTDAPDDAAAKRLADDCTTH